MNSIEELRDYRLADEIQRIQSLSREQLLEELIEIQTSYILSLNDREILSVYGKQK